MGLAERRAIKDYQDTDLVALDKELRALTKAPLEVAWEQLAVDGQAHLYKEAWTEIFFKPVIEGLRQIARDDMGKEALAAGLKRIVFKNTNSAYSPTSAITFADGALVIDHELSNVGDTADRTKYLVELVEKGL